MIKSLLAAVIMATCLVTGASAHGVGNGAPAKPQVQIPGPVI